MLKNKILNTDIPQFFLRIRKLEEGMYALDMGDILKSTNSCSYQTFELSQTFQRYTGKIVETLYHRRLSKINRMFFDVYKTSISDDKIEEIAIITPTEALMNVLKKVSE